MRPIAYPVDSRLARYVGAFRVMDENGLGTDEVLFCETPIRLTRKAAIADAIAFLEAMGK